MEKNKAQEDYKDLWIKVNRVSDKGESKAPPLFPKKNVEVSPSPTPLVEEKPTKEKIASEASNKIVTQTQAIDYSIKIIKFLDGKRKEFNKANGRRMSLDRFKEVFCFAATDFNADFSVNKNAWSIAHINNFIKSDCKKTYDTPSLEDIELAKKESEEFDLIMDFDLGNLFLEDKPVSYSYYISNN